jgi:hypothetical protein
MLFFCFSRVKSALTKLPPPPSRQMSFEKRKFQKSEKEEEEPGSKRLKSQPRAPSSISRARAAEAFRAALPANAFPSPVLEILLDLARPLLLCEMRVAPDSTIRLMVHEIGSDHGAVCVGTADPQCVRNANSSDAIPSLRECRIVVDSQEEAVLAFFSTGVICKWYLAGPVALLETTDQFERMHVVSARQDEKSGRIQLVSMTSVTELDREFRVRKQLNHSSHDGEVKVPRILPLPRQDSYLTHVTGIGRLYLGPDTIGHAFRSRDGSMFMAPLPYCGILQMQAWNHESRVLFYAGSKHEGGGVRTSYYWTHIHPENKAGSIEGVDCDLLRTGSILRTTVPLLEGDSDCLSFPCDGTLVLSSVLLAAARSLTLLQLRRDHADGPLYEWSREIRIDEPGFTVDKVYNLLGSLIVAVLGRRGPGPKVRILLVFEKTERADVLEPEDLTLVTRYEEEINGASSNLAALELWR